MNWSNPRRVPVTIRLALSLTAIQIQFNQSQNQEQGDKQTPILLQIKSKSQEIYFQEHEKFLKLLSKIGKIRPN